MSSARAPGGGSSAPRSLAALRSMNAGLAATPVHEFSVKNWLGSARDAFAKADANWAAAQLGRSSSQRELEEAYVEYRKAAEIVQKLMKHPEFTKLKEAHSQEYYAFQSLKSSLLKSGEIQKSIAKLLEQRYGEWQSIRASTPQSQSTQLPPVSAPMTSQISTSDLIDSYAVDSPPTSPNHSRELGSGSSSAGSPVASISDRLAALRTAGMPAPSNGALSSSTRHSPANKPPPVAPKPSALSSNKTPPGSPVPPSFDLNNEPDNSRSGSAPPVIPLSGRQSQTAETMGLGLGNPTEDGIGHNALNGWTIGEGFGQTPRPSRPELGSSESSFGQAFPSVDELDSRDWNGYARSPPSSSQQRPVEVDASELDRKRFIQEQAMAKLGGAPPSRYTNSSSSSESPYEPTSRRPASSSLSAEKSGGNAVLPPTGKTQSFGKIPFSSEVLPSQLWDYLRQAVAEQGKGPRVLLIDVRSREEFERGCVRGEVVCLEPVALRAGISSTALESGFAMAPKLEESRFAARHHYDVVIIYDRSSALMPTSQPANTSPAAQQTLWALYNAIYQSEFAKSLKRQPVMLKGGWEAWQTKVGEQGIFRSSVEGVQRRENVDEFGALEAKKQNRKASVVPGVGPEGGPAVRNGAMGAVVPSSLTPGGSAYGAPVSQFGSASAVSSPSGYFGASNAGSGYRQPQSNYAAGLLSPRLAMPPTAAQRAGSTPSFEAFSQPTSPVNYNDFSSRPSYTQPQLPSYHQPLSSSQSSSTPAGMSRTSGYTDLNQLGGASQHSFSPRAQIDYPSLRPAPAPPTNVAPHGHRPAPPPPISAPTRPAPAAPAPLRSNSGVSLNLNGYSPAHNRAPTGLTFGDEAIGLTGLKNLGNTCYMNSTVQCLSATIPFAKYFKDGAYRKDINTVNPHGTKGALADAVAELIRALWANQYLFLSPVTFRENICRVASQFRGSDQHDAQEFLGFLLDGLHEDLNYITKKPPPVEMSPEREHALETMPQQIMSEREWEIYRRRDDSFVVQCFQGQFRNQLRCLTCGATSTTYNTFMPLSVPVPSGRNLKVSLMDCINSFVREEIMEKDEAWNCPKCKTKRKASKKLSLSRLPPILVIHLKRFSFKGPFSDKIETQVEYPLHGLDLTNFVPPPLMEKGKPPRPPKGWVYDLYAVTNHYGNLSSGHYTAYVRSQTKWNHIGDSKVSPIDPSVLQTPQAGKSSYVLYLRLR